MAKKAVTLTLLKKNQGLKSFALNPKSFSESNEYINVLKKSLDKKGVIITNFFFINEANTFKLKLQVFFKTQKLKRYKKKCRRFRMKKKFKKMQRFRRRWKFFIRRRRREHRKARRIRPAIAFWDKVKRKRAINKPIQNFALKNSKFDIWLFKSKKTKKIKKIKKVKNRIDQKITKKRLFNIKAKLSKKKYNFLAYKNEKIQTKKEKRANAFKNIAKFLPVNNSLIHEFEVLNGQVFSKISLEVNDLLQSFKRGLFSRRINLYMDFLKITALFIAKKIKLAAYNIILGTIFKFLLKRSHNRFFAFLKKLFTFLLKAKAIAGIKLIISGKLKGKLRAKPYTITVGNIGAQKTNSNIDFSKVHIHTLYGCFGFKTLIKYKQIKTYAIRSKKVKI